MNKYALCNIYCLALCALINAGCISITREEVKNPVYLNPRILMPPKPASELTEIPASSPLLKIGSSAGSFALVRIPPYKTELKGSTEVRVRNPNSFPVLVMIRSDEKGKNIEIPGRSMTHVYLPDGGFSFSFIFQNVPNAVMRGDHIHLPSIDKQDIGIPVSSGN